jgi:Domain of unknown function (DUF4260)
VIDRLPRWLLRVEGLALFVAAVVLYFHVDGPWWLLLVLALAPDLSMVGYAAGPRVGAAAYDAAHTTVLPLALGLVGVLAESDLAVQLALIWLAHIGADRALGYGLKSTPRTSKTRTCSASSGRTSGPGMPGPCPKANA